MASNGFFSKEKFIDILNAKADMALGTPKQVFYSVVVMLEALPATDVVEVVRCKDCVFYVSEVCIHDLALNLCRGDDFCSYGERREQE